MKTIMLVCAAGMSTSLMVSKMKNSAEAQGIEADIFAIPTSEVDTALEVKKVDVMLLGPQVRYMKKQFEAKLADQHIPVDAINMQYYGTMNGEKVLEQALALISAK